VDGFRFLDLARDAPALAALTADGALDPRALVRLQPTVTGGLAAG